MEYNVQLLSADRSEEFCRLFDEEGQSRFASLWQDRSPNFFSLYSHMASTTPLAFGLREPSASPREQTRLLASSLLVPFRDTFVTSDGRNKWSVVYDTDCFVAPASRSKGVVLDLIKARNKVLMERQESLAKSLSSRGRTLFFGIENQKGFLRDVAVHPQNYYAKFVYGPLSVLHDVYPNNKVSSVTLSEVDEWHLERHSCALIDEAIVAELKTLDRRMKGTRCNLFPQLSVSSLRRLAQMDSLAELWIVRSTSGIETACTVANMQSVRKFRYNSHAINLELKNHPLSRLGLSANEPLRSLVIGQIWQTSDSDFSKLEPGLISSFGSGSTSSSNSNLRSNGALAFLLNRVANHVSQEGFHNFYLRDSDTELIKSLFIDSYHYPRHLVFWCLSPDPKDLEFLQTLSHGGWQFKVDNHFL